MVADSTIIFEGNYIMFNTLVELMAEQANSERKINALVEVVHWSVMQPPEKRYVAIMKYCIDEIEDELMELYPDFFCG